MKRLTSAEVLQHMKKAGLKVQPYKRGPLGPERVSLAKTRTGDGIHVWLPENAKYEAAFSPTHKQVLLRVYEKTAHVPNTTGWANVHTTDKVSKFIEKMERYTEKEIPYDTYLKKVGGVLPVAFRPARIQDALGTFVPDSVFVPQQVTVRKLRIGYDMRITGYSRARSSKQTFLIGVDEKKHFISPLKTNRSNSVREAHRELRPKGISANAKRHGEWFFDPISKDEELRILRKPMKVDWRGTVVGGGGITARYESLESGSTHEAHVIRDGGNLYAVGKVKDTRKGYHKPLVLEGLHRVVRNNELKVESTARRRVNYD